MAEEKSLVPITILKDLFVNRHRTYLYKYNEYLKPISKSLVKFTEGEPPFNYMYTPYHFHDGVEILRVEKGSCTVIVNDQIFTLTEKDLILINSFEAHSIYLADDLSEFRRTAILFQPDVFFGKGQPIFSFFEKMAEVRFYNFIPASNPATAQLIDLIDGLVQRNENGDPLFATSCFGDIAKLYGIILQNGLWENGEQKNPYLSEFAMQAIEFINNNFTRDVSTNEIADYCKYTSEHFCRLFRKCFGTTFKDYFNAYRIQRAKSAMRHEMSQKTVAQIAYAFGFSNQNHFTNTFKKYTGMRPYDFLKSQKQKEESI